MKFKQCNGDNIWKWNGAHLILRGAGNAGGDSSNGGCHLHCQPFQNAEIIAERAGS